ncbi:MAG TPA: hypothetical protein VGQ04_08310 [Chitinophagaceae bacterium]|jgi:hypothetical protein|nr:hypothetical protein [Chitinophagaceae bacterium]
MKTRIWLALIITFVMISCGKDKFETIPQLEYKSRNTDIVPVNGSLRLNIEFRDKEGDVNDSVLIVRQRLNKRGAVQLPANPYGIPHFPTTDKGEFEITLDYQFQLITGLAPIRIPGSNPVKNEVDTLRLKIVARDHAGNKSDTLVVDNVYVIR